MSARTHTRRLLTLTAALGVALATAGVAVPATVAAPARAATTTVAGVSVLRDLSYPTPHGPEGVDVYLPPASNTHTPYPGIVFVHGGGWTSGDKQGFATEAEAAARHGYVGISINYDMAAPRDPREAQDVAAAVAYARDNAVRFHLDPDRLAAWGGSAGAHLVMQAGITDQAGLQAVVGWSGPYDLTTAVDAPDPRVAEAVNNYLGCADMSSPSCAAKAAAASPALHTTPGDPPVFLVNSTDELVPASQMNELADNLRAHGDTARTLLLPGDRHATAYADDATAPTLQFLDAQLRLGTGDPVLGYYRQLGGQGSYLGPAAGPEYAVPGGRAQDFAGADGAGIYWSPSAGAHVVHGDIRTKYLQYGGPSGMLGFPTTGETGTPDGVGRFNHFDGSGGASIYWTRALGAHEVQGAIRAHWRALGWERGPMGYPTTDERGTPDGVGRYNHFTGGWGASIYWTPWSGAWSTRGDIRSRWASLGWERSSLGYPTSDEYGIPGGRANDYEHGTISWNAATHAT